MLLITVVLWGTCVNGTEGEDTSIRRPGRFAADILRHELKHHHQHLPRRVDEHRAQRSRLVDNQQERLSKNTTQPKRNES
jgi:hypothetical protein